MKKRRFYLYFILFIFFTVAAFSIRSISLRTSSPQEKTKHFTKALHEKETIVNTLMEQAVDELKKGGAQSIIKNADYYEEKFKKQEVAIIVSKNDSMVYWSTNSIPVEDIIVDTLYISEVFKLSNGWYEIREKRFKDYLVRGAILLKREYHYENDYLKNEYQKDFLLDNSTKMQLVEGENNVFSKEGYLLCSLLFNPSKQTTNVFGNFIFSCFILAYIFFISFLVTVIQRFTGRFRFKMAGIMLASIVILLFCYALFAFRIPSAFYTLGAFGPKYYASSAFLPSLGNLVLNVLTIFIVALSIFKYFRRNRKIPLIQNRFWQITVSVVLIGIISFCYAFGFDVIKGLIINSKLLFDLNNIFSLDFYSVIGLITVAFILLICFLVSFIFTEMVFLITGKKLLYFYTALAISGGIAALSNNYFQWTSWSFFLIIILMVGTTAFFLKRDKQKFTLQAIAFYIVIFSLFSTNCFYKFNNYKEREKRKLLASQIAVEQDPIAEYLFKEVETKIKADSTISKIILSDYENKEIRIGDIIQRNYLTGFWSSYNFTVIVCQPGQVLNVKPENIKTDCDTFFGNMIKTSGIQTLNPDLYFINEGSGNNRYLAVIPFDENPKDTIPASNLYLELSTKFLENELGYPDLLIDKNIKINRDLNNYSYAKYLDNDMFLQNGKFYYSHDLNSYNLQRNKSVFFEKDGYDHYYYRIDAKNSLIISKKSDSLLYIVAPFSYIFVFYCIFTLLFFFAMNFPMQRKMMSLNFKTRIQIYMVAVLVVSFVIIGVTTLYYLINLSDKKNLDNISEKAHSVLLEIENKIGNASTINADMKEDISELLSKLSNVFFTDINLYTPGGLLVASSRPQVFDEGMISRKMDANAYNELVSDKKTLFVHKENIGDLKYISAYIQLRDDDNELIGYINLPYFAKQSEFKKEISTFLITFININVLLTALAIIIALLVSNYISRPMRLIMEKLGKIKLGKKNEKIDWIRNDEIGGLVSEYNRMIEELAISAEMLAKSERETAWREMAKQVAHEIKNPLTPMKLSVQHLQKSWLENNEDWGKRLEKFTKTMIEQIDSLSKIASEFSDFAKMPHAINEPLDLVEVIENAVLLYQDNRNAVTFKKPAFEHAFIFADKTQMLRVFHNLIKNSVQAISEVEKGKVEISLDRVGGGLLVKVSDNGVGIPENQYGNIFSPNFTTKTGGMGLGLAMVKSIVESYAGKVWFESESEKRTTFFVVLNKYT